MRTETTRATSATFAANRAQGRVKFDVHLQDGVTRRGVLHESGSLRVRFPSPEAEGLSGVFVNTAGGIAGGDRFDIDIATGEGSRTLAGFENHAGRTGLRAGARPLGRVRLGHGNNGDDRGEGATTANVIGTYLHGPLLAHNAWFADDLIRRATGLAELRSLEDELEDAAHDYAVRAGERR
jgi:cobyric acid synthase